MTIEKKIEIMQYFADGGEVEMETERNIWISIKHPTWNWLENTYRIKPEPTPQSLEDRIKAEYPEYEVVMLEWGVTSEWVYNKLLYLRGSLHIYAQSMKGFCGYLYHNANVKFTRSEKPVRRHSNRKFIHPIAVLFAKDSKEGA